VCIANPTLLRYGTDLIVTGVSRRRRFQFQRNSAAHRASYARRKRRLISGSGCWGLSRYSMVAILP
jgi:hypothetical protein